MPKVSKRYLVVVEKAEHNYSAYVPDVPGCIVTAATLEEVREHMTGALRLFFDLDISNTPNQPVPEPETQALYVDLEYESPE